MSKVVAYRMLIYATSNILKFNYARDLLAKHEINISQQKVDIIEIQAEEIETIALNKARRAFEVLQQPLLVNDSGWEIPALKGFPGPFMSYVESWLNTEDFLNLMRDKQDKRIFLEEVVVYMDEKTTKSFSSRVQGQFLEEPDGPSDFKSLDPIVSFRTDLKSLAKARESSITSVLEKELPLWDEFARWYTNKHHDH